MALTDSLIAYWKLDEASGTRNDSHGANHLTDNNTVTAVAGKINDAAQFTAANSEYLSIADNADLSTGDIDFTATVWAYFDSLGASNRVIAGKYGNASGAVEWVLFYRQALARFQFSIYNATNTAQDDVQANNLGAPSTATWYFIAVWHDATANKTYIQVNNGTVDETAETVLIADSTGPFRLGFADALTYMDGRIDECGFWKRVLTAGERTELYGAGTPPAYPWTPAGGPPLGSLALLGVGR